MTIAEKVAAAMRECYGKWLDEGPLVPFEQSDKREVWVKIAEIGIETYEKLKDKK